MQRRGEIPLRHFPLALRRLKQRHQAFRQIGSASWFVELDGQAFFLRQLAEVANVRSDNRNPVLTRQMRHATRSSRRRIGHHRHAGAAKHVPNHLFGNIAGELDSGIIAEFPGDRFHIPRRFRMIASGDNQLRIPHSLANHPKGFDQQIEPLVGAPFSKGQNIVRGIAPAREVRIFRLS